LSGAPVFDRERRFQGYRGFGMFTGETATFATGVPQSEQTIASAKEPAPTDANGAPPAHAAAPANDSAAEPTPAEGTPDLQDPEANAPAAAERSAEILPLRAPTPAYVGAPNVIPIRPGALSAFAPPPDAPATRGESI